VSRFVDRGAIFGGYVGLGMALVLAMAFELIIPVQTVVFILAPLMGVLIGVYANVRSERWRPRGRVMLNSIYAGIVTGVAIAVLYVLLRLVFIYGDTGALPDGTSLSCRTGPDCIYQRYVRDGQAGELAALGITDAASLEAADRRELFVAGSSLIVLTVAGAIVGGVIRSVSKLPTSAPLPRHRPAGPLGEEG
jgi:amino acid transporter